MKNGQFDFKKTLYKQRRQCITKSGHRVDLFCLRKGEKKPIVGGLHEEDGSVNIMSWAMNGKFNVNGRKSKYDLVNIPGSKEVGQ